MTEFLSIAPESSFEAVRRMIGQRRNARLALLLPDGWLELSNVARSRLLLRQAEAQRCQLAIITTHRATHDACRQVGLPVFARAEKAENDRWRMEPVFQTVDPRNPAAALPEPPPWRRTDEVRRIARPTLFAARQERIRQEEPFRKGTPLWMAWAGNLLMGGLIMLVLGAFTWYVLPAATVTLVPGTQTLTTDVQLAAVIGLTEPDPAQALLPARTVKIDIEETGSAPTTGSAQKATDKAVGEVIFSNLGSAPVNIPAGTSVSTSTGTPVQFRTVRDALLESGVGTRVTVPIEALEPGIEGNVRSGTINTVSGPLRFRLRVSNSSGTFGGGAQLVPVVTQEDRDKLVAELQLRAEARAYEMLVAELEPGEWLPPESVQTFVVAQSFDQYNDEEAEFVGATVRILAQGMAVTEADAAGVILAEVESQVPALAKVVADSIRVQRQPGGDFLGTSVGFTMTVIADYTTPIDPQEVRRAVAGLPPAEASILVQERWYLQQPPDIFLDPAWRGVLPDIGNRIQVRIELDE